MNVASVAPSRNHLIDSKQATHRLRRHLDGVFEGLGVRPCVLDDAIGTRDGDALVASARAVGGPQIEQHVEAIGPRVFDEGPRNGLKRSCVRIHGEPAPPSRGLSRFTHRGSGGDVKAASTEEQAARVHGSDHRAKRVEETSNHFLGGRARAAADVDARQPAVRMLEDEAFAATFVPFEGLHRKAVKRSQRLGRQVVKVFAKRRARHLGEVLSTVTLHVCQHDAARIDKVVKDAGLDLLGADDEARARGEHRLCMRVEKRILGGHEGLELVHVVDFNFGLTNTLLQGKRPGQDRDLDLLQMSRLTVQCDALVEDDSVG